MYVDVPGNGSSRRDVPACRLLWLGALSSGAFDYFAFPEIIILCGFFLGVKQWEGREDNAALAALCLSPLAERSGGCGCEQKWKRNSPFPKSCSLRHSLVSANAQLPCRVKALQQVGTKCVCLV